MTEKIFISKHPLVAEKLARLRDKKTTVEEFRRLMSEVSMLLGYEALSGLRTGRDTVGTPLGRAECVRVKQDMTFIAILRAGLGMLDGLIKLEPSARLGHIGIYRNEETLLPVRYYVRFPKHLDKQFVVVVDPMLATGGSAAEAVKIVKLRGAKQMVFMCLIAARQGLDRLGKEHPDVPVYVGAVDQGLTESGYIVPGLGDAGDRMFGTL